LRKRKDLRLPNNYGGVVYLGEKRRRPYGARITIGFEPKGEKDGVMQYKQKYKYLGFFEKRTEALECLMEYNKNPYDLNAKKITFEEVYNEWSQRAFTDLSKNSIRVYKTAYKKCEPLHPLPFVEIRPKHLQDLIDNINSPSACKPVKLVLGLLYKYAIKHEIIDRDYSKTIDLPKIEKKQPPKPFIKDEIEQLWKLNDNKYAEILLILLYTGLRVGELLILENKNIYLDKRYMIGGFKTDAGTDRIIPIHSRIKPLIEKHISKETTLFYSRAKTPILYETLRKKLVELFNNLDMKHTAHDTRHTFISQAERLGLNNLSLKRIVGHADASTTEHYTHKDIEDLVTFIDNFNY